MRRIVLLGFLFFFIPANVFSQSHSTSHAFQLQFEALGPGVSSSFSIDSPVYKKRKWNRLQGWYRDHSLLDG
jgi:hypothetical protein